MSGYRRKLQKKKKSKKSTAANVYNWVCIIEKATQSIQQKLILNYIGN